MDVPIQCVAEIKPSLKPEVVNALFQHRTLSFEMKSGDLQLLGNRC
jgi:hypothetical protein